MSSQERLVGLYRDVPAALDPNESIDLAAKHFARESASFPAHKEEKGAAVEGQIRESLGEDGCEGLGDVEERKG